MMRYAGTADVARLAAEISELRTKLACAEERASEALSQASEASKQRLASKAIVEYQTTICESAMAELEWETKEIKQEEALLAEMQEARDKAGYLLRKAIAVLGPGINASQSG